MKDPPEIYVPQLPDKPPLCIEGQEQILDIGDVLPGDVLMSSSTIEGDAYGYLSWLVRKLDQDWYSHTAFFDGEYVIESGLGGGVKPKSLEEVITRNRYTDVYRFQSDECLIEGRGSDKCRSIGSAAFPIEPLREVARSYVEKPYATTEALLSGLLMLRQRKLITSPIVAFLLRSAINIALGWLREQKKKLPDKAALTCSELVYRIFNEAQWGNSYRLIISDKRNPDSYFHAGRFRVEFRRPDKEADEFSRMLESPSIEIPVEMILSAGMQEDSKLTELDYRLPEALRGLPENMISLQQEITARRRSPLVSLGAESSKGLPFTTRLDHDENFLSPADICNSSNLREIGRLRES